MSINLKNAQNPAGRGEERSLPLPEYELSDIWNLDKNEQK